MYAYLLSHGATPPGNILTATATPAFSPAAGTYSSTQSVTISCATPSHTIYYTTNGSTPTTGSAVYSSPIAVSVSGTLKAIATAAGHVQSAVGSAAYTISIVTASGYTRWQPGDYALTVQYHSSISEAQLQIRVAALQTQGITPAAAGITGYAWQLRWGDYDQGTTQSNSVSAATNGTGQYAGFQDIGTVINYLQSWIPGAYFQLYVNGAQFWGSPAPTTALSNGVPVPAYIQNCGGTITVPNSFGSSSTTTYSLGQQINGQYGWACSPYNNPNYSFIYPTLWEGGVNQCWINFWQAISLYQFTVSSGPWQNGVNGNPATWTLDTYPGCTKIINNDEYSYQFTQGPSNTPAYVGSQNAPSAANNWSNYLIWATAMSAAFPHLLIEHCLSYTFQGTTFMQSDDWLTMLPQLFAIPRMSFGDSDTYAGDWLNGYAHAADAKLAMAGIRPSSVSGNVIPAPQNPVLTRTYSVGAQVQDLDYSEHKSLPPGVTELTASIVTSLAQARNTFVCGDTKWSIQDTSFSYTSWNPLPNGYIQPTFTGTSGRVTYPNISILPSSLFQVIQGLTGTINTATRVTLNWAAQNGVTYLVTINGGSAIAVGTNTYTATTLTPGTTYTFAVAMTNANGTGSYGSGISVTTPALAISVVSGAFVNPNNSNQGLELRGADCYGLDGSYALGAFQSGGEPTEGGAWAFGGWNKNGLQSYGSPPDINWLLSQGVTHVRIPLNTASILNYTTTYVMTSSTTSSGTDNCNPSGTYLSQLTTWTDALAAVGITSTWDLHNMAPDMIVAGINGGSKFHVCPNVNVGSFFNSDNSVAAVQALAPYLATRPYVMLDLFNEPVMPGGSVDWSTWLNGGTFSSFPVNGATINYTFTAPGMQAMVTAARAAGITNVLLLGGVVYALNINSIASHMPTDSLNQLAVSVHIYSGAQPSVTMTNGSSNLAIGNAAGTVFIGQNLTLNGTVGNFTAGTTYYVVAATTTTIKLSATLAGAPIFANQNGSTSLSAAYNSSYASYYASSYEVPTVIADIQAAIAAGYPVFIGELGGQCNGSTTTEPFIKSVLNQVDASNTTKRGSLGVNTWSGIPTPSEPAYANWQYTSATTIPNPVYQIVSGQGTEFVTNWLIPKIGLS